MVTIFDLRAQTVSSWREVFNWAQQASKSAPLPSADVEKVTGVVKELKDTDFKEDYFHSAFIAFWRKEKLVILRFDRDGERGEFPSSFSKLLKIASDAMREKQQANRPSNGRPSNGVGP